MWAGAAGVLLAVGLFIAPALPARSSAKRPARAEAARSVRAFGGIQPRLSPRGDQIAFSYQGAIWRMPREGGVMKRITAGPGFDVQPAWSPDGKRIAYINSTAGTVNIIDVQKGTMLRTMPNLKPIKHLSFGPGGKQLFGIFFATDNGFDSAPGRIDLETGKLDILAPSSNFNHNALALSPDGTRIVYARSPDTYDDQEGNFGPGGDLWLVPSQGGTAAKLGSIAGHVYSMWWHADRVFLSTELGSVHNDLWSLSIDDPTHAHRETFGQPDEEYPSVSQDGKWLVYSDNRDGATALVVRDLETGVERNAIPTRLDFGAPTGMLRVTVAEKGTGIPLVARLSIQQQGGKGFAPVGSLYRVANGAAYFYFDHAAQVEVPAGSYVIRGFRGLEYRASEQIVEIKAHQTTTAAVELERWTNPIAEGLYGGESHIHANYGRGEWYHTPETIRLQIEGEGLNVANMVVANGDGDAVFDREFFRGAPDPVSSATTILYWNEEYRATLWGHMTFLNLKYLVEPLFTGFANTTNPWDVPTNGDVSAHVHEQGGVVNYTHPGRLISDPYSTAYSAKAMPVDVALGKIDSVDINGGQFTAAVELWYKLLNCGFHLAASAGTDSFLNRMGSGIPGSSRAYVKINGPLSHQAWAHGIRDGRAFVTNGPMLDLAIGGAVPGDTLRLPAAASVPVRTSASWHAPLDRVELVYNGEIVEFTEVRLDKSGWLSLRAYGPNNIQAHTSPIYVEIAGQKDPGSRAAAEYYLAWIDRLEKQLKARDRLPTPAAKAAVAAQIESARAVYRKIAVAGRVSLFDGKSLAGWEGGTNDTWRVRDGVIVGGSFEGNVRNAFLATRKSYRNFILKVDYKLVGTEGFVNGGVQFRSKRIAQPSNEMSGYQADIGTGNAIWVSGCLYDESRRKRTLATADKDLVARIEKRGAWNTYEIRAEGPRIRLFLNGEMTVDYTEREPGIDQEGVIALQIHGGCKAEISFRNLTVEPLPAPGGAL